jgi:hypothetical protein
MGTWAGMGHFTFLPCHHHRAVPPHIVSPLLLCLHVLISSSHFVLEERYSLENSSMIFHRYTYTIGAYLFQLNYRSRINHSCNPNAMWSCTVPNIRQALLKENFYLQEKRKQFSEEHVFISDERSKTTHLFLDCFYNSALNFKTIQF